MRRLSGCWLVAIFLAALAAGSAVAQQPPAVAVTPGSGRPELVLQTPHKDSAESIACSPDGRYLATASGDKTAALWETATGRKLRVYAGHERGVDCVAFSPDGTLLATGSTDASVDSAVFLWRVISGEIVHRLKGPGVAVNSLAFSPDGRWLLTGHAESDPESVVLWDVASGTRIRGLVGAGWAHTVCFSPDGRLAAIGNDLGVVTIWEAATGVKLHNLAGHPARVREITFSPDGQRLAVVADDDNPDGGGKNELAVWDWAREQKEHSAIDEQGRFQRVTYTRNGKSLLTDGMNQARKREFNIWNPIGLRLERTIEATIGNICGFALHPDGKRFFTADSAPIVWELSTWEGVRLAPGGISMSELALSPDGKHVLTVSGPLTLWDTSTGQSVRVAQRTADGYFSGWAAFTPDSQAIVTWQTAFSEKRLRRRFVRWSTTTGELSRSDEFDDGLTLATALSRNGRFIVTAGQGAIVAGKQTAPVKLFDASSGKELREFGGDAQAIQSVAIRADGSQILGGDLPGQVIVWDTATGRELKRFDAPSHVGSVTFSPDGSWAVAGCEGPIVIWDIGTGKELGRVPAHKHFVSHMEFTPDARWMITGGNEYDGRVIIWNTTTWKPHCVCVGHTDDILSTWLTPDKTRLISSLRDGTSRVWDTATGRELARMFVFVQSDDWLTVTPDGLFDGSGPGRQKVMYRIGSDLNVVPVDRFFQDFYRPGLLAEVLGGSVAKAETTIGRSLPPTLKIVSPPSGEVESREATLDVEALDQGGGAARLALYQNGARVLAPGETRREGNKVHRTFQVVLIEGRNEFRVTAASDDGSWESEPAEVVLTFERPVAKSRLHVLVVGINRYADANLNLKFAAPDAKALAELFRTRGDSLYEQVNVVQLIDDQATRDNLKAALKQIAAQTRPQDTLVVFFAGHGTMVGQRYVFVPHELRKQSERLEDDLRAQGLAADEIADYLAAAKALKRVLILDTCSSGGALAGAFKARSGVALRAAVERLSRGQGIFTIAASAASEEAQESQELGHGVLSYALLAGLKAVDRGPLAELSVQPGSPDRVVDVMEWFAFASGQVPRLTERLYGASQDVQTSTHGTSFPLLPIERP